jgi:hypothetical protein
MRGWASTSVGIALVAVGLSACQSANQNAKGTAKPLFIGSPRLSDLRPETASASGLGAPVAAFKRLTFSIRVSASGKIIGESTETLKAASGGYGQYVEDVRYRLNAGKCTVLNRTEGLAVGGFLTLLQAAQTWSPDCEGWGAGYSRREVAGIRIKSGQLFPLKVGNKLLLQYTVLGSDSERDTGTAQYEETAEESYEVVERIPEFRLDNGRSLGEAFLIRVAASSTGRKKRSYEFVFSTRLGWRVAYSTDVKYALVDWTP